MDYYIYKVELARAYLVLEHGRDQQINHFYGTTPKFRKFKFLNAAKMEF